MSLRAAIPRGVSTLLTSFPDDAPEDLPPGFEEIPPEELGFTAEDLSSEEFTVESVFTFMQVEPLGFIMSFTTLITSTVD